MSKDIKTTNKKSTKRTLLTSFSSLLICMVMFIGTTFAWFTDNVISGKNIIKSGNLDLEMYWTDELDGGEWYNVEDDEHNTIFDYDNWEPGYTEVKYIKLVNKGNLALNYNLALTPTGSVGKLAEVINVFYANDGVKVKDRSDLSSLSTIGLLNNVMDGDVTADGTLLATDQQSPWHKSGEVIITLAMNMITTAGNEYQDETIGDGFTITALATQCPYEEDSFGSDYDANAEYPELIKPSKVSASVTPVDGKVPAGGVTLAGSGISATVPEGVLLEDGVDTLTLTVTPLEHTTSDITVVNNEILIPVDVHIEGVSENNITPIIIDLGAIMPKYLNMGNYKLFHVEDGTNNEMTLVDTKNELNAHNQFTYEPVTGEVSVAMSSFSEVAFVADTSAAWQGGEDYDWYNTTGTLLNIANADQLHAFSKIVGGMAKDKDGNAIATDSFSGKTVKLLSDINLNHGTVLDNAEGTTKTIFYPIGYYNNKNFSSADSLNRPTNAETGVESTVYSFEGTFDGNGHTIANFYQNTWEMFGDYNSGYTGTPNYYKDAMGLFGYVNGGTVKNLTIHKFESDGEFTPTGVIAAYADGDSTFENIAITNCNPRVYNTGNGSIIGVAGSTDTDDDSDITLKNITVDNSNIISALWGSWDVACGGLVGMYRGNVGASGNATGDTISFTNCHVAAQIDVYNDVCANYQYYAYRYAGMIIGSVRHNTTNEDGKTIPDMTGISASGCTVNYGTWNDYYYCEFEKNTMASYSEDYQFSRIPHSELSFTDLDGNQKINSDEERNSVTGCSHSHTDEEDKRAIYLPFHQLFTGYSWGVNSIGLEKYSGIVTDLDINEGDQNESVVKFEKKFTGDFLYRVGNVNAVSLGTLFATKDGVTIENAGVWATVDKVDKNTNVSGTFTANTTDWTKGTIQFSGTGVVKVTIQDYNFCTPTTIYLEIVDAKNITSAASSTNGTDVVLLQEVNIPADGAVHYTNCTVYGNGFKYNVEGGMNKYNSAQGHGIIIANGATIDNLVVCGDVYDTYGAYTNQEDYTSAIDATNTIIQNCHISNCSAPVRANGVTITNTTLYGGTVANLIISGGTNTLEDVTTVNYNDGRGVLGFGIVISDGANENVKLVLNGELKQHNFVCADDVNSVPDDNAKKLFNAMFDSAYSAYHFGTDPVYANPGILSMVSTFDDSDITNNTGNGYTGTTVSYDTGLGTATGYLYSLLASGNSVDNGYDKDSDSNKSTVQGDYLPIFNFDLGEQALSNDGEDDTRYLEGDVSGVEALYQNDESPITLDLTKLAIAYKYEGLPYTVSAAYKDANGNLLGTDTTVSLTASGSLVFTVTDNIFYDKTGERLNRSVDRTYEVPIIVSVKQAAVKNAVLTISKASLTGTYTAAGTFDTSQYLSFNPLDAITVTDYDASGTGTTVDLTANISTTTVVYVNTTSGAWGGATITITYTDGRVLTIVLGSTSMNSPGASNGGKTITVTKGTVKSDGKVAKSSATGGTWPITSYSFKGNNGSTVSPTESKTVTVTFEDSSSGGGCVTPDTLVTLADGTQKEIQHVTYEDELAVWDFVNGQYTTATSSIIMNHGYGNYKVVTLNFADGTAVNTINGHGFFDQDTNEFVILSEENVEDYIGHDFVKQDGKGNTVTELVSYSISEEYTESWSVLTAEHYNCILEGMLTLTPAEVEDSPKYLMPFEIGEGLTYDSELMQADIEKYGLYTYDEFADLLTYEQFYALNLQNFRVAVGKGFITYEEILYLINLHM